MTVTQPQPETVPDEVQAMIEPGQEYHCDSCRCDLTHSTRIKCADPVCDTGPDGVDICPACFCAGKEFGNHRKGHQYRVIEINSYPIFSEDWGADEELALLTAIAKQGMGNWKKIAEHVGGRTKEEVEAHYNAVYIDSPNWPIPFMEREFDVEMDEFHARKRRRISEMSSVPPPTVPKTAPVSGPAVHEISGFLPGRLEFEHELDNDAEDLIKDLEFGVCLKWGGDLIVEDETDLDVKARIKWEEEKRLGISGVVPVIIPEPPVRLVPGKGPPNGALQNGFLNGFHTNGTTKHDSVKSEDENDEESDEPTQPPPIETEESLKLKLTLLEMYAQRVEKRAESKAVIFERGLLEYKKMQATDKKRPREDREILHRLRPFARLQTAEDYEAFSTDILYEAILRKRIQELQQYRRLGLTTAADIEKYELDLSKRTQAKAAPPRDYYASERLQVRAGARQASVTDTRRSSLAPFGDEGRKSHERETTPRPGGTPASGIGPAIRRPPAPLNLANSPSLHLLTPGEQTLCSTLRILPKPYLVIKETLVREYARRGGKLRRREARDLVKIDVNKTSRIWDFLVQAGYLKITADIPADATASAAPSVNGSPSKATPSAFQPSTTPLPNGTPHAPTTATISPWPLA